MLNEQREIRASFDHDTITVYQAYNQAIAKSAVKHQTFVSPPFKMDRMTWIKPSFLWAMYRSGWATKQNQEHILAIKIRRDGFQWALDNSCLSHYDSKSHSSREEWKEKLKKSPVRIQWDPERDIHLKKLDYRSIQIGLSGEAVNNYVNEWIVSVTDITQLCRKIQSTLLKNANDAISLLPKESPFPSC